MSCNGMAFFPANYMLQSPHHEEEHHHHHHPPPPPLNPILPSCNPQDFHGVASFLGKRSMSFLGMDVCEQEASNGEEDLSDDGSAAGEKKRRLNMEQVKTLEKNFELGNKLEPERKMQLARALGLQPRQIAIWFQNRRARWKTKQLERDYDLLKRQFDAIKADNEALQAQNHKLHAEILALRSKEPTESINLNKDTEGSCSNRSENSSDIKLDISRTPAIDSPLTTSHHHHHHHHQSEQITSRALFPSPSPSINRPTGVSQLFPNSSSRHHLIQTHNSKSSNDHQMVKEESFTNMFCSIDDQPSIWPWLEHQHFN